MAKIDVNGNTLNVEKNDDETFNIIEKETTIIIEIKKNIESV